MKLTYLFAILLALTLAACGKPTTPDSPDPSTYGLTHEGDTPTDRHELEEKPQDSGSY
jgi:hypothetical protein